MGVPGCHLEKGMFEKLFNLFFNIELKVDEIMCYSMGDEKCVYQLQP